MVASRVVVADRVIGVDLGGTKILAGVVERDGTVVTRAERPTPLDSQAALLEALAESVEECLSAAGEVAALGFGVPSRLDTVTGAIVASVNVPLTGLDLDGWMTERFSLPVGIENDGSAATLAEWRYGAGRGSRNLVMLTLGTGIGGGVVLDGRPLRGWAELGHIVVAHDGPPCPCGGRGHLEAFASGTAGDGVARGLLGPGADAAALVAAARGGDGEAREALERIGGYLGSGLGSLVNIFNPELVVVGGGFAAAGALLLEPARAVLAREALPPADERVRVVPAELGGEAGLVGAALIAFEACGGEA